MTEYQNHKLHKWYCVEVCGFHTVKQSQIAMLHIISYTCWNGNYLLLMWKNATARSMILQSDALKVLKNDSF